MIRHSRGPSDPSVTRRSPTSAFIVVLLSSSTNDMNLTFRGWQDVVLWFQDGPRPRPGASGRCPGRWGRWALSPPHSLGRPLPAAVTNVPAAGRKRPFQPVPRNGQDPSAGPYRRVSASGPARPVRSPGPGGESEGEP